MIDGLDELSDTDIIDCISYLVSNTPSWLKIIITARPESIIKNSLKKCDSFDLLSEEHFQCISDYCIHNLGKDTSENIIFHSGGSFLYANLLINQIKEEQHLSDSIIPSDIDSIYRDYCRRFKTDYHKIRKILEVVVSSLPIESKQLTTFTGLSPYEVNEILIDLGTILDKEYMYTVKFEGHIIKAYRLVFFHKSFRDWLSDPERSGMYYVDPHEGLHAALRYMEETQKDTLNPFPPDDMMDQRFILDNKAEYLARLKKWPELESLLTRGRLVKDVEDMNECSEQKLPLIPYFYSIIHFPKNWKMDNILAAIDYECKKCMKLITNGYPSQGMTSLKEIMMVWSQILVGDKLCDAFEKFITDNLWIPKLFASSFSDSYNHPGLVGFFNKDKLVISLMASRACDRYTSIKGKLPIELVTFSNNLKIKSLYYEGIFDWDFDDISFFEDNPMLWLFFKRQVCSLNTNDPADLNQRDIYNTICAMIELNSDIHDDRYLETLRNLGSRA